MFDANTETAAALASMAIYNLPLDWWAKRAERYAAIDAEGVHKAYETQLAVDKLRAFVVGDAGKILPQLEKLGLGKVAVQPAAVAPKVAKKK